MLSTNVLNAHISSDDTARSRFDIINAHAFAENSAINVQRKSD